MASSKAFDIPSERVAAERVRGLEQAVDVMAGAQKVTRALVSRACA